MECGHLFDAYDWKISANNTALTEALKRLTIYSQMAEKDDVRDISIRALFKLVEGYVHIPIAEMRSCLGSKQRTRAVWFKHVARGLCRRISRY